MAIRFAAFIIFFCTIIDVNAESNYSAKKALICGVCKDISPCVQNTIRNIETLGSRFQDYAVIIYENNSKDDTPIQLSEWASQNNRITFVTESLTKEELSKDAHCFDKDGFPSRMEIIARARNIVLALAKDAKYDEFEYLIMVDLDFAAQWPIDEIIRSTKMDIEWDCIAANGVLLNGKYWDYYSFRSQKFPLGPELLGDSWWHDLKRTKLNTKANLIGVYSAFGGLAIYRRSVITNFTYSGSITEELTRDYRDIIESLPLKNSHIVKYFHLNGLKNLSDFKSAQITYRINSGYTPEPVVCEHVTLHAAMRVNGYDKIYINPKMIMQYNF